MIPIATSARRVRYKAPTTATWTWDTSTQSWTRDGKAIAYPSGNDFYQAEFNTAGTQTITPGSTSIPFNMLYTSATGTKTINSHLSDTFYSKGTSPSAWISSGSTLIINAIVNSSGKFYKMGTGKLQLNASNTFTNGIVVREGTLGVGSPATGTTVFGAGGLTIGELVTDTPTLEYAGALAPFTVGGTFTVTVNSDFTTNTVTSGAVFRFGNLQSWNFVGTRTITTTGAGRFDILGSCSGGSLIKNGTGQIGFSGDNSAWEGTLYFYDGSLIMGSNTNTYKNCTLQIGGSGSGTRTIASASGNSNLVFLGSLEFVESFTFNSSTYSLVFSSAAHVASMTPGTPVTATIGPSGIFTLGGLNLAADSGGLATGSITKAGGNILVLKGNVSLEAGLNTSELLLSAGTIQMQGSTVESRLKLSAGTFSNTRSPVAAVSVTGNVETTGSATVSGAAAGNNISFDGSSYTASTATQTLTVSTGNLTINCPTNLSVALTKGGAAILTFASSISYSGTGRIVTNAGTVAVTTATFDAPLSLSGGTFQNAQVSAGSLTVLQATNHTATTTVTGTDTTRTVTFNGNFVTSGTTITTSTPTTINGIVSNSGASDLILGKAGASTLTLNGNNTIGGCNIQAGTMIIGHVNALGKATQATTIAVGATLNCSAGLLATPATIKIGGTFTWSGTVVLDLDTTSGINQALQINGTVNLSSGNSKVAITAKNGTLPLGGTWIIATYTSSSTSAFLALSTPTVGGVTLTLNNDTLNKRWTITT